MRTDADADTAAVAYLAGAFDSPTVLAALRAGVAALVLAKLAEYEEELTRVAGLLRRACVTATLERHRLAVLRGQSMRGEGCDDVGECLAVRPLRARYRRLRALLIEHGGAPVDGAAYPPPVGDNLTELGLHGVAWVPERPEAPQYAGAWRPVQVGTDAWASLSAFREPAQTGQHRAAPAGARPECGFRPGITAKERGMPAPGVPPSRRSKKRRRDEDSDDSDADDAGPVFAWRVPAGLRAWDLPAMGVPWAAVTCPWLDRSFAVGLAEEANRLWLAETGFDTRPVALPAAGPGADWAAVVGPRESALREAVREVCAMAAPRGDHPPVSTVAIQDFGVARHVEAEANGAAARSCRSWLVVAGYVADLVRLVVAYGTDAGADGNAAMRDELGTMCNAVLMGPSGTGKTEAARRVARVLYGCGALLTSEITEVGRADLVAGYVGQTESKTLSVLNAGLESLVFIDEAYSLGLSSGPEDYGNAAASVLVQFMTARENQNRIAIWAAGYGRAMRRHFLRLNEGIGSRFQVRLEWGGLVPAELVAIVGRRLAETGVTLTPVGHGLLWEGVIQAASASGRVNGNARSALRLAALLTMAASGSEASRIGAGPVTDALAAWRRELSTGTGGRRRGRARSHRAPAERRETTGTSRSAR